jgi:GntR family transcriptional regulator / MocR family aminotransferase
LSELKLRGRSAPALASLDKQGRVIHLGSFSKTISPTFRLGFIVAPVNVTEQFAEAAACLGPAPGPSVQIAGPRASKNAPSAAGAASVIC